MKLHPNPIPVLVPLAIGMAVSGCAAIDPLRGPEMPQPLAPVIGPARVPGPDGKCEFAGCLETAVEYAERWRQHYYSRAANTMLWRNSMLFPILPLSAVSLYRSTKFDNSSKLVAGYAVTAGTLYGLPQFFGGTQQQLAYLNGAEALTCSILDARKVLVRQHDFDQLSGDLTALEKSEAAMRLAYNSFRNAAALKHSKEETDEINRRIADPVRRQMAFYVGVYKRARALHRDLDSAGELLRRRVELISVGVARQIENEAPDPAELLALAKGFKTAAGQLGQGAFPAAAAVAPASPVKESTAGGGGDPDAPAVKGEPALLTPAAKNQLAADIAVEAPVLALTPEQKDVARRVLKQRVAPSQHDVVSFTARLAQEKPAGSAAPAIDAVTTKQLLDAFGKALKVIEANAAKAAAEAERKRAAARAEAEARQAAERKVKHLAKTVEDAWNGTEGVSLSSALAQLSSDAERVYFRVLGWDKPVDVIDGACDGKESGPRLTVSPEDRDISITKGDSRTFTISNADGIPSVTVAGQNTTSLSHELKVAADSFSLVLTGKDLIPDGQEAIVVIADRKGQRKVEIKVDVVAKKNEDGTSPPGDKPESGGKPKPQPKQRGTADE